VVERGVGALGGGRRKNVTPSGSFSAKAFGELVRGSGKRAGGFSGRRVAYVRRDQGTLLGVDEEAHRRSEEESGRDARVAIPSRDFRLLNYLADEVTWLRFVSRRGDCEVGRTTQTVKFRQKCRGKERGNNVQVTET